MNGAPKPPKTAEAAVVFNSERREKPISSSPKSLFVRLPFGNILIGFLPAFTGNTKHRFARLSLRFSMAFSWAAARLPLRHDQLPNPLEPEGLCTSV
jgi:hypothetical protein